MQTGKNMTFKRFGRTRHLRIETAKDLQAILDLDEAHWVAVGAPVGSLNCDADLLAMIDSDHNGRIMCFELREAIAFSEVVSVSTATSPTINPFPTRGSSTSTNPSSSRMAICSCSTTATAD